ncbi:GPI transamidase component PIG-T [Contarinia nasturtii]|uniref:GPI transamidase component PIG-T n=1 Tax=Contarinia nasturtii TaxID=265458 RepID=UPI0012D4B52A|nr:GPI transamidase component PIG-T [Contarinia nasturtii]
MNWSCHITSVRSRFIVQNNHEPMRKFSESGNMYRKILVLICLFVNFHDLTASPDRYNEELFIKALHSGHVYTYFQFTTEWIIQNNESFYHTHLVARPLAEIISKYDLMELHVSLTNGLWRYESWGYPVVDSPGGAEVTVWFNAQNRTDEYIDEQWKELCGILSGLLCASFSFIDKSNTVEPEYTFRPTFSPGTGKASLNNVDTNKYRIRYATLPREIVCTENLTPWKKLLPGSSRYGGTRSLLNSGFIHTTNYHSLGLHVRRLARTPVKSQPKTSSNQAMELLEIKQTVNCVFDTKITSNSQDWSLRKLFGQGMDGAHDLAESTKIYVDITDANYILSPEPTKTITTQRGGTTTTLAVYDVKEQFKNQLFSIAGIYPSNDNTNAAPIVSLSAPPPLYAKRFLLGVGQERGKILTKITNTHWAALNVVLQENLPWFVPVYLHTLTITVNGVNKKIKPNAIKYKPGRLRERPSQLEIAFKIPNRCTVDVAIDFDYVFLKWLEYPPDANHGHYIGSAILVTQLPVARNYTAIPIDGHLFADSFNASRPNGYLINIRTESLLITLPTPDFSMPYNVICLACTVVALAFGPIHNFSTKKLTFSKKSKDGTESAAPKSLLAKIKAIFKK